MTSKSDAVKPKRRQNLITGLTTAFADNVITHPLWTLKTLKQQGNTRKQIISNVSKNPLILYNGLAAHLGFGLPVTTARVYISAEFQRFLTAHDRKPARQTLLLSSFVAGMMSTIIASPSELVRTILLKKATVAAELNQTVKSDNFIRLPVDIARKKGIRGLMTAYFTVCIRDGSYTCAFFTAAPLAKGFMSEYIPNPYVNSIVSYILVSLVVSLFNHPCDTIKTVQHTSMAMNYLKNTHEPTGFVDACKYVIQKNGYLGFWKGYVPRGFRLLIGVMVNATCIEQMNIFWTKQNQNKEFL